MPSPKPKADVLLLHGDERFLIDEKARATLEGWRSELVSDFGFERIEGHGLNAARLQDSVLQAPFLDPYRVVAVTLVPAARAESLAPALTEVPASTRVLITIAGRLGGGNRLAKAIMAAGGIVEGSRLTAEVVTELLAGGREDEIFKLTDNLLPHPTPEALKIARGLSRGGMQPTSVAYRMARHIALVLEVRAKQERGESLSDVKSEMSEHPFVIQKAFDVARDADPDRLETALRAIRDYEWEVKSGQIDPELGLDVLLTRL